MEYLECGCEISYQVHAAAEIKTKSYFHLRLVAVPYIGRRSFIDKGPRPVALQMCRNVVIQGTFKF